MTSIEQEAQGYADQNYAADTRENVQAADAYLAALNSDRVKGLVEALGRAKDELLKVHRYFDAVDGNNVCDVGLCEISARGAVGDRVFDVLDAALEKWRGEG